MGNKRKIVTQKVPMETVFASQLVADSFVRSVSFVVLNDNGPDTVASWGKKHLSEITDVYEYVDTEKGRLPRFIKK
jgi:hypothetical protein